MPLELDPYYMPDRGADKSGGNVRMLDHERRRVVNTFVSSGGLRRHGNLQGIDANAIDDDVPGYLLRLLDPILTEAAAFYDDCLDPKPAFLIIERNGVRARRAGQP